MRMSTDCASSPTRDLGFPIEDIRSLVSLWSDSGRESADVKRLALDRATELHRKALALEAMRTTLVDLAERCQGDDPPIVRSSKRFSGIENLTSNVGVFRPGDAAPPHTNRCYANG